MDLVILIGAQAVGKMTVGEELKKITDLKLFHNHMSIELGLQLGPWGSPVFNDVNQGVRDLVMDTFIKHKEGLIFTYVWAFDLESDWAYMEHIRKKFQGYKIHYVELVADIRERVKRNESIERLQAKPSKRNIDWSREELLSTMKKYRLISKENEIPYEHYIKIDTTNLSAKETARRIKTAFHL